MTEVTFDSATVDSDDVSNSTTIEVRECGDRDQWRQFLDAREGTLFHRWNWESVFAVYSLQVRRFAAHRGDRIVGVLPLVRQTGRVFGDQFVSLPWFDATGILAVDSLVQDRLLLEVSRILAAEAPKAVIHIRQREPLSTNAICRRDKVMMRLELDPNQDQIWERLKAKVRNQIRKSHKSGLQVQSGGQEHLASFYRVYAHNMRDLGSPSHSLRFFQVLCDEFARDVRIFLVVRDESVIGGALTIANGDTLEIPWASSLREFNGLCVNHAMYWDILQYAVKVGFRWFNFGRSTVGCGTYNFKRQWGAEPLPLSWHYLSSDHARAESMARPNVDRFSWAQRVWAKLPVRVTRLLGPRLIAKIP